MRVFERLSTVEDEQPALFFAGVSRLLSVQENMYWSIYVVWVHG